MAAALFSLPGAIAFFGIRFDRPRVTVARRSVALVARDIWADRRYRRLLLAATVFGVGNPDAEIMFIGEAPGADEDAQGEPFVGRAGQLLTKIIKAMGFAREEVYIANILKCRPDVPAGSFGNRPPTPREMQTCRPYLMEQIAIIKPKVIVALGAVAVEGLLGTRSPMRELRGRWNSFDGTPLMITYHPAYLLRNQSPSEKRKVWEDMMQVLERLEKPISEKQRNYFL